MNKDIPLIIFGLIFLYIILSISQENFNQDEGKLDLIIKPTLLKGHLPIGNNLNSELTTKDRENVDKYIKESMLLNKPNHDLGFQPANVRFMDLMYNKPSEIGTIPLFKMTVPDIIKIPKLTQALEEKDNAV